MSDAARGARGATGATGDTGDTGAKGDKGERGMPQQQRRAIVYLFLFTAFLAIASTLYGIHDVSANNQKFCAVVTGITIPVPRPANPASNPSREHQYIGYLKVVRLAHDLGCN